LFVCLSEPINVKTAEPIGPEFCVRPGKVCGTSKFEKIVKNRGFFLQMRQLEKKNPLKIFKVVGFHSNS